MVTILQYAPLYCFSARVPLYLGFSYDRVRAGSAWPPLSFFAEPVLTDSGVFALLLMQHAGIWLSSFLVIAAATRVLWLRVVLAAVWGLNPLLYAVAQTVGSEALSAILLLLVGGIGLRVIHGPKQHRWWILSAVLLALSMLTRHINGVVAALLPVGFGACLLLRILRRRGKLIREARLIALAIAVAFAGILLADGTFRITSNAAGIHFHRRIGFSFLFRLDFLGPLTSAEREPLLNRAAAHARSPLAHYELDALRAMPVSRSKMDVMALLDDIYARLPKEITHSIDKSDAVLNDTARAFLISPSMPYLRAVAADLARSERTTVTDLIGQLLKSTTVFFDDPSQMEKCANLVTFRATDRHQFLSHIYKRRYFAVWKRCTYARMLLAVLAALAFVITRARPRLVGYAIALLVVGFLSVLGNCVLNEFQPRYTLPMWVLTIVCLTILLPSVIQHLRCLLRQTVQSFFGDATAKQT